MPRSRQPDASTKNRRRPTGRLGKARPWLPVLAAFAFLTAYSMKTGGRAPLPDLTFRDKIDHFSVYGLLGILTLQALPAGLHRTARWLLAFAIVSAFGICDEVLQHFNPARTGDPLDWFADSVGALLAVACYSAFPWLRALADWSPIQGFRPQKGPQRKKSLQANGV